MKIAIFDKWLNTMGGGEKVATVMAEALSKAGHEVYLVSHFEIEKKELSERMGADLSRVKIIPWYERSHTKLTAKTKEFDLFINVSFLDHTPTSAKKSAYYIHFPTPIKKTFLGLIKYDKVLPFLRKFLLIPEVFSGLKPIEEVYARGGKWLEKESVIVFSNTPEKFNLTIRIYAEKLKVTTINAVTFESPNAKVKVKDRYVDHHTNILVFKISMNSVKGETVLRIKIDDDLETNAFGLVSMTVRNIRFFAWNLLKRFLPEYEMALYGSTNYRLATGLDDYDLFLSNSKFTKKWTKEYWGKNSKVLYPPVDIEEFKPGKKKNMILNVGRFFVGGHSKRQDILIDAFKEMIDEGQINDDWELHLVGGIAGGREHTEYINKLKKEAENYPIYFHIYAKFDELKKLYSQAKIYWHATGHGVNENHEPIKMEHFGITPVEAMAAGVVPIVYDGGGVKEAVDEESGFTWSTKSELIKKTQKLASDSKLRNNFSAKAIKRAKKFSKKEFAKKLLDEVENL